MAALLDWPRAESHATELNRIKAEYLEMPGLCLTPEQMQRLWRLDGDLCHALIDALVADRFLRRTPRGCYAVCRPTSPPVLKGTSW
jgi:hypothetical protein